MKCRFGPNNGQYGPISINHTQKDQAMYRYILHLLLNICRNIYNPHSLKMNVSCVFILYMTCKLRVIRIHAAGSLQTYIDVSQNLKEVQVNLGVLFQIYI